jgi:prepilin-type processing-associated H-X9-DG protein
MRVRLGLLFAALLMIAGPLSAQPLADRVPGDALIYIGWGGSERMGPGFEGSHFKAVLDESKVSELVNRSIPNLLQRIGATDRAAAHITEMLSTIGGPMWRHPTAFYFGGLDLNNPNGPQALKMALICDAGAEGPRLADQLKKLVGMAQVPFEIKVEEQGGLVVVASGAAGWGAAQKPVAALPASKTFQAALAQVQKDSVVSVYIDVEGIVKLADQLLGGSPMAQQWGSVRDALGLTGVKRMIATAGFDGKDWMGQAFVEAPAPRSGPVPGLFNASPLSQEILRTIPQSATVAMAGKFDLGALVNAIRTTAAKIDPQAGQAVEGALAQVRDMIGLDLQTDLFDVLGDEWALYDDPMTAGNGLLGFAVVNRTRNPAKLEGSLTKLEDMTNSLIRANMGKDQPPQQQMVIEFKRTPLNGATLHHFAIPVVSPSWAIKDGNLYLGLYPQVVEGAVEQVGARNKSILENEDFIALRKRLGDQQASGMSFINLPKTAPDGYQEVMMAMRIYLGFADMFGADTPAMLLPPLRKIMPHLSPAGGVSWSDAAGWHSKSVEPFPGSEMLTPGGGGQVMVAQNALLLSIMLPSLNRARETANRVKCASNMRQIGQGIILYANENKGNFPPDQGTIFLTQDIHHSRFICPSSGHEPNIAPSPRPNTPEYEKWRKDVAEAINKNSDYVYPGKGMNFNVGAETIILYEKPDAHGGQGMNILYGDGHVEFMFMRDAQRLIEAQKAGRKGGNP